MILYTITIFREECIIMITYRKDIIQALKDSGYNTWYIRTNKILSESTMSKLRNNNTSITLKNLDVICKLLNCQPNDIIEYVPDEENNH